MSTPLWQDRAGPPRRDVPPTRTRADQAGRGRLWVVALVATLLVIAIGGWLGARATAPHPVGPPHAGVGLTCEGCHDVGQGVADACIGCHGPHASTRPGHRNAAAAGLLGCGDCHPVHGDAVGVAFDGAQVQVVGPDTASLDAEAVVSVVRAETCRRCHRPADPQDPMTRCLDRTGALSLCFDEHVAVRSETLAPAVRDRIALWSRARTALDARPPPARVRSSDGWVWGVVALLGFAAVLGGLRFERTVRRRPESPDVRPPTRVRLPQVDAQTCLGCSACVDACPYDVLAMRDYVATVERPQDCCGLTTCQERCPNGSLVVHDGEAIGDRPAIDDALQSTDVPGLYLAGDLTGMPLIRNAINQGAVAVQSVLASGRRGTDDTLDALIVGAGPAGLSAALEAQRCGLRYAVVEQGSLAQSIRSFPRGKLVFDQPLSVPLIGDLWLAESTKEELLRHWTRIVRSEGVHLHTHHRVVGIERTASTFTVRCLGAQEEPVRFGAANVVLAIGRRGTPRRLEVPIDEVMEGRVHYSLADAQSFAQQACVVVGLGDVAMEAALALSYAAGARVTVLARGDDFRRGKARNVAAMKAAVAAGRLEIRWGTQVSGIEDGVVRVEDDTGAHSVGADAVFVMVGSIAPWSFLASVGVRKVADAGG